MKLSLVSSRDTRGRTKEARPTYVMKSEHFSVEVIYYCQNKGTIRGKIFFSALYSST